MITIPYLIVVNAFVFPTEPIFTHKAHPSKYRHHYAPPKLENCQEFVPGQKTNQDFIVSINDDDMLSIEHKLQMMMFDYLHDQEEAHRQSWTTLTLQVIVDDANDNCEWNKILHNCGWSLLQSSDSKYVIDPSRFVQHTLRNAISSSLTYHKRLTSLRILAFLLSKPRTVSFDFSSNSNSNIIYQPSILPSTIVQQLNEIMTQIKQNGWLSTNPDSVDSLPSLHLNIISDGHLLFQSEDDEEEYPNLIRRMHTILEPYLIDVLLPQAQQKLKDENIQISDVFVRNYGQNVIPDNDDECGSTRFGLSEHYDITAAATCVMALDDVASQGTSGLYTIVDNECTHKALKQFFPLQAGDGVIHTWDILHGVDIDPTHQRTSLIVWFTKSSNNTNERNDSDDVPLWLSSQNNDDNDAVQNFVLALSKEQQQHPQDEIIDLIIKSASLGNNFALTRLGTILMDQVDNHDSSHCDDELELIKLSSKHVDECHSLVNLLSNDGDHESLYPRNNNKNLDYEENVTIQRKIAIALLKEASLRGSAVAQVSYADSLMEDYFMEDHTDKKKEELMMDAAILLTLASQQDYKPAHESIQRLSSLYYNNFLKEDNLKEKISREEIQNDFLQSNIMQIIQSNTPDNFVDYIRDSKIP